MPKHSAINLYVHGNQKGSLGRTAQDVHLDSHTAPELSKLSFLMFKALKTNTDNISVVGAFVLTNNKENLNLDGYLWYFGGISSSLKAVYFGHTNKKLKNTSVSGVLQKGQFIFLSSAKALFCRHRERERD